MERLSELLMDSRTANLLDRNNSTDNLTWDLLFQSAHRLILKVKIHYHTILSNKFTPIIYVSPP